MTECWEINPPIALADTMSSTAIVEYKKSKIAALLLSDSFAHNGFWTVPNPKDSNQPVSCGCTCIPHNHVNHDAGFSNSVLV